MTYLCSAELRNLEVYATILRFPSRSTFCNVAPRPDVDASHVINDSFNGSKFAKLWGSSRSALMSLNAFSCFSPQFQVLSFFNSSLIGLFF